jgi:hypothetical protein
MEVLITPVTSRGDVNPSSHQYLALMLMPIVFSMGASGVVDGSRMLGFPPRESISGVKNADPLA